MKILKIKKIYEYGDSESNALSNTEKFYSSGVIFVIAEQSLIGAGFSNQNISGKSSFCASNGIVLCSMTYPMRSHTAPCHKEKPCDPLKIFVRGEIKSLDNMPILVTKLEYELVKEAVKEYNEYHDNPDCDCVDEFPNDTEDSESFKETVSCKGIAEYADKECVKILNKVDSSLCPIKQGNKNGRDEFYPPSIENFVNDLEQTIGRKILRSGWKIRLTNKMCFDAYCTVPVGLLTRVDEETKTIQHHPGYGKGGDILNKGTELKVVKFSPPCKSIKDSGKSPHTCSKCSMASDDQCMYANKSKELYHLLTTKGQLRHIFLRAKDLEDNCVVIDHNPDDKGEIIIKF